MTLESEIFNIKTAKDFNALALEIFQNQAKNIPVYKKYLRHLKYNPEQTKDINTIPFLPIRFFKSYTIKKENCKTEQLFKSSGTTLNTRSKHHVSSLKIYKKSFTECFNIHYGNIKDYTVLALLPSYIEQGDSSLIYMVNELIKISGNQSQFIPNDITKMSYIFNKLKNKKVLLIGVSYALLEMAEQKDWDFSNWTIMETGGMKGKRKELTRGELHHILKSAFNVNTIHSEYGMTELLSQAYCQKDGYFSTPPWMKVKIREVNDPFSYCPENKTGGINIIDLANINSCSFIATDDLGKKNEKGFKVLGRFDQSDVRGCNQLNTIL